jgi:hypothetical protein
MLALSYIIHNPLRARNTFGMISKRGMWKVQGETQCPPSQARNSIILARFLHFFQLWGTLNGGGNLNTYTNQLQKNVSPVITSKV